MRTPCLLAILAIGFAGCGGDDTADRPAQAASGEPAEVFSAVCGGCHTLAAADTSGKIGPNLDELEPDAARVVRAIEGGPGTMPPNLLKGEAAQEVADYVAQNAGS